MKIKLKWIEGKRVIFYCYRAGGCMDFELSTLCEVGQPYQKQAESMANKLAAKHSCTIQTLEFKGKPYLADCMVKIL